MRSRESGWLAVGLIVAGVGILGGSQYWIRTRTFVPLDIPISLSRGHIRTGEFRINLNAFYSIEILQDRGSFEDHADCENPVPNGPLKTLWVAKVNGRVAAQSSQSPGNSPVQGCYLGGLTGEPGRYELDIEVLSDSGWLDAAHPRLHIETNWGEYDDCNNIAIVLIGVGVLLAVAGTSLFVLSSFASGRQFPREGLLAVSAPRGNSYRMRRRDLRPMDLQSMLSPVGYVYALTWFILLLVMAPFILGRWWTSHGIPVRLLRPGVIQASIDQHTTGLLVYVDQSGSFYLNSKPVTAQELPRVLEEEFSRRPDWSVYVEGDSDIQYQSVVQAMDLVRSVHGKVILLTPKMRAEAQTDHR